MAYKSRFITATATPGSTKKSLKERLKEHDRTISDTLFSTEAQSNRYFREMSYGKSIYLPIDANFNKLKVTAYYKKKKRK